MTTPPVGVERRIGQRFAFNLPVALHDVATAAEGCGFTQDVSSRGAFLFTDLPLSEGAEVELTLKMPSEITLGESMRVRCRGRVLRVVKPADSAELKLGTSGSSSGRSSGGKFGVAVCLRDYEYLAEPEESSADFRRMSALHGATEAEHPTLPLPLIPRVAAQ